MEPAQLSLMTTSYKCAEDLADWAREGRAWLGGVFFAILGGFVLAVISPGLLCFYLLFAAQENAGDLSAFFGDWRVWGAVVCAFVMHFIYTRLL
jgi:hypothetical protein